MIKETALKQTDKVMEGVGVYMAHATALRYISKLKKERDRVQHLLAECKCDIGRNEQFMCADQKKITMLEAELKARKNEIESDNCSMQAQTNAIKNQSVFIKELKHDLIESKKETAKLMAGNSSLPNANGVLASKTIANAKRIMADAISLMEAKNADYGDSWRMMRTPSITDQILVKVHRIRSIEESPDDPKVSEGIESEYRDILNYCVFAMIQIQERTKDQETKASSDREIKSDSDETSCEMCIRPPMFRCGFIPWVG